MTWVAKLLPKEEQFYPLFEKHAEKLEQAAKALDGLMGSDGAKRSDDDIIKIEKSANTDARKVLDAVRTTFVTPFNRVDVKNLITEMNACLHDMRKLARVIRLFEVSEFDDHMRKISGVIVECTALIRKAMPLLADIDRKSKQIIELCEKIAAKKEECDDLADDGLQHIIKSKPKDAMAFLARSSVYDHLAVIVERLESIGNDIHDVVIDQV